MFRCSHAYLQSVQVIPKRSRIVLVVSKTYFAEAVQIRIGLMYVNVVWEDR